MKKTTTRSSSAAASKTPAKKAPPKTAKKAAASGAASSAPPKKVAKKAASSSASAPKKATTKETAGLKGDAAAKKLDQRIAELGDWRGDVLSRLRKLIHDADPQIEEEWKWMGTPCFYHQGGVCTGESYKEVVKLTFFKGATLSDPKKLFNSSMDGNVRRAIDFRQGEKINEAAFKALIKEAVALNVQGKKK